MPHASTRGIAGACGGHDGTGGGGGGIIIGAEPYHASYGYACKMNCGGQYVLAACGFGAGGGAHRYTGCAYEAASYGLPVCGSH